MQLKKAKSRFIKNVFIKTQEYEVSMNFIIKRIIDFFALVITVASRKIFLLPQDKCKPTW